MSTASVTTFLECIILKNLYSNNFWHLKQSDFYPYFNLNQISASKVQLFLSNVFTFFECISFLNPFSNSFWHSKESDFYSYFDLNQRSVPKIQLFLSTASVTTFLECLALKNQYSNNFWHFKQSDFYPYFKLNQISASKVQLFLSTVFTFLNLFHFKIHSVIAFDILKSQIFILTLIWTKDLFLKFSCFCLLHL